MKNHEEEQEPPELIYHLAEVYDEYPPGVDVDASLAEQFQASVEDSFGYGPEPEDDFAVLRNEYTFPLLLLQYKIRDSQGAEIERLLQERKRLREQYRKEFRELQDEHRWHGEPPAT